MLLVDAPPHTRGERQAGLEAVTGEAIPDQVGLKPARRRDTAQSVVVPPGIANVRGASTSTRRYMITGVFTLCTLACGAYAFRAAQRRYS